jgi:hypothetical protein
MKTIKIEIDIERGNPNVGYAFQKDGQLVTWDELTSDERQKVVNSFAGGYGLFAGHIDIPQESNVQLR